MDTEDIANVKISNRCRVKLIHEVFNSLDDKHQELFTNSCFGHLLSLRDVKLASQLVHQLILRSISTSKENEIWIKIGDKLARFGLQEFTLVTGLKAGNLDDEDPTQGQNCRLVKERFKRSNGKIKRGLLLDVFKRCKNKSDKYKLGLLVVLVYVLVAAEENTYINLWWFYLVDDLDRFNNYSWGKKSYEYTIKVFKRNLGEMLKSYPNSQRYPYSLHGFPLAIMIWAFEAIPNIGKKFGRVIDESSIPRMIGWEMRKQLRGETLCTVFESSNIEVHTTLNPTADELLEPFWQKSGPFDDEVDPKFEKKVLEDDGEKNSESDDAPSSSSRPQSPKTRDRPSVSSHQHSSKTVGRPPPSYDYLVHIIKQEIRGAEERLRGEMSERFDRIERKIDLFLRPSGRGGAQSERSGFDDHAFSTDNQQNEEARVEDDVIIEDCSQEEVTPNKQHETFPTYDDGFVPDPSSAIVVYQRRPLVLTRENFQTEEARQDLVTEKAAGMKDDLIMCNNGDSGEPSTSSHVCQPSNEIIVIEDPNSESAVGRGHRVKRRAAVLLSPYINPLKRRKLLDIQEYDPLREVDPAKVEDLNKWLTNALQSDVVSLALCEVRRNFFDDLLKDDGWLIDDHVNSALYHIRERAVTYPHIFQQDCAILDCSFWQLIKKAYLKMGTPKKKIFNYVFDQELVDYVEGASPVLGKHWSDCRFLYVPYCVPGSHWFALKIDLKERTIYIYDSLPKHIRAAQLAECMKPIQVVLPWLIKVHVAREENFNTNKFHYQRVVVPGQVNGSDCGLFTIKYIEFLQAQFNLDLVRPEYMPIWRKKLAAELFAWHFDP